jgi:hypothetical protein
MNFDYREEKTWLDLGARGRAANAIGCLRIISSGAKDIYYADEQSGNNPSEPNTEQANKPANCYEGKIYTYSEQPKCASQDNAYDTEGYQKS